MYHKIIRLNDYSGKMHASSISVLLKNAKKTSCDITLNLSMNKTYLNKYLYHEYYLLFDT